MPVIKKNLEMIKTVVGHRVHMRRPGTIARAQLAEDVPGIYSLVSGQTVGETAEIPVREIVALIAFLTEHTTKIDDGTDEDDRPCEDADSISRYYNDIGFKVLADVYTSMHMILRLLDHGMTVDQFKAAALKGKNKAENPPPPEGDEDS